MSLAITLETHITDVVKRHRNGRDGSGVLAVHSIRHDRHGHRRIGARSACATWCTWMLWCPSPARAGAAPTPGATREARLVAARLRPISAFPPPDPAVYGLDAQNADGWGATRRPIRAIPTGDPGLSTAARRRDPAHFRQLHATRPRHHRRHPGRAWRTRVCGAWRLAVGRRCPCGRTQDPATIHGQARPRNSPASCWTAPRSTGSPAGNRGGPGSSHRPWLGQGEPGVPGRCASLASVRAVAVVAAFARRRPRLQNAVFRVSRLLVLAAASSLRFHPSAFRCAP